jgi:hypothetical protein
MLLLTSYSDIAGNAPLYLRIHLRHVPLDTASAASILVVLGDQDGID